MATTRDPPMHLKMLVDRISDLPEPLLIIILSFLPTHLAAQASILSRRFRNLWSESPSVYFDRTSFGQTPKFLNMVDSALRGRADFVPVEQVRITSSNASRHTLLPMKSVLSWFYNSNLRGIKHLNLTLEVETVIAICHIIFSIKSLESLHISTLYFKGHRASIPVDICCTRLRRLYMWLNMDSADLTRLVSGLPVLEILELRGIDQKIIDISSQSLKTLKLECNAINMMLSFPLLDFLYLNCKLSSLEMYQGETPLVSKAEFILKSPVENSVLVVGYMLKSVANSVELCFSVEARVQFEKTYLRSGAMPFSMPRLECLEFISSAFYLKLFQVEMPMLRKANIVLCDAREEFVLPMRGLLKSVQNVVALKLYISDHEAQVKPFRIFGPNKQPPFYPHLVYFKLYTCCHEATIQDVINLLENSPVLNCLKMEHKDPYICDNLYKKKTYWQSKLPRNSEGNFQHACFTDLRMRDEKSRVIKILSRRLISKKRKICKLECENN